MTSLSNTSVSSDSGTSMWMASVEFKNNAGAGLGPGWSVSAGGRLGPADLLSFVADAGALELPSPKQVEMILR